MTFKVLVCGSRNWDNAHLIWEFLEILQTTRPEAEVIHGAARGADTLADKAAKALGLKVTAVPADWEQFGKAAGPMRNKVMLGMAPDRVIAFRSVGDSKGTDHMIDIARRSKIPTVVVDPSGKRYTT